MAQFSITYAPQSVRGWGGTPSAEMYAFSYGFEADGHPMEIGIMHIRHNNPNVTDNVIEPISIWAKMAGQKPTGAHLAKQVTGLYFLPFIWEHDIKKYAKVSFSVGGIYFDKATPTKNAEQFNLLFRLRIDIHLRKNRRGIKLSAYIKCLYRTYQSRYGFAGNIYNI